MSDPRIVVIGGGLAGLSAAVACADTGAHVTLLEERTRLGGATWSTERDGLWVDNGQHVFLRCCEVYRGFLERLGVEDRIRVQHRLDIPVISPEAKVAWLRRRSLPAPFHLVRSLLTYCHVSWIERVRIGFAMRALAGLDRNDPSLDELSFGEWLRARGQSSASLERFWEIFVRATLNAPLDQTSLALATVVFQIGILGAADAGDMGFALAPLQQVHGEPAGALLEAQGATVALRAKVARVELGGSSTSPNREAVVLAGGKRFSCDAVVLAVPHESVAALLPPQSNIDSTSLAGLGATPIVNLHVIYDRRVTDHALAAGVGGPVQWVFDRTESSGLAASGEAGQYLAISLSAAEAWVGVSNAALQRTFEPALQGLFPAARHARILRFFATCERRATFRQAPGCQALRPGTSTGIPNVHLAGAWTDTGWPATMEGAVRSGLAAARAALLSAGRTRGLPAIAAA